MGSKQELPPLGGRQNLRKPMPRHTRYKGESYDAWDIANRYAEHMAKQRAAEAAKRAQEEAGHDRG
jgi:hypothetical protein